MFLLSCLKNFEVEQDNDGASNSSWSKSIGSTGIRIVTTAHEVQLVVATS